ncbi:unnamed protein product [marine sediment metagenome]|uniref:HEPN domain-containing protein n=1 Tax=marine sediment metagenome TaxID=412755 RepID=X1H6H0_9ZZZZ
MIKQRPELAWFTGEMEKRLWANEWKEGWTECDDKYLLGRAEANLNLARMALVDNDSPSLRKFAILCCADAANFCMMIADNAQVRGEDEKPV